MKVASLCAAVLLVALIPTGVGAATELPPAPTQKSSVVSTQDWPLPRYSGSGRRIVYSQKLMHVWLVNSLNQVVRHYAVTGRADWPRSGRYYVFGKSRYAVSWDGRFYMYWMTRFVRSTYANIGFHSIPMTWAGNPIQTIADLGKPLGIGGCVRLRYYAAKYLYDWARIGTPVYVIR